MRATLWERGRLARTLFEDAGETPALPGADALHLPHCRIAALAASVGVLGGDARPGGAVVAGAVALLLVAAGRTSSGARDRPRIPARQLVWSAARFLDGGNRFP